MNSAISSQSILFNNLPLETSLKEVVYIPKHESKLYFLIGVGAVVIMLLFLLLFFITIFHKPDLLKANIALFVPSVSGLLLLLRFSTKSFFTLLPGTQALVIKDNRVRVIADPGKHWRFPFFEKVCDVKVGEKIIRATLTPLSFSEYSNDDVLTVTGSVINPALYQLNFEDSEDSLKVQAEFALDLFREVILNLGEEGKDQIKDAQLAFESDLKQRMSRGGFEIKEYRGRVQLHAFRCHLN